MQPVLTASGRQPVMFDTASRLFAIIIGIVAVVAGLVVGINNPLLSNSAGREGTRIDQLFSLTLGIATVVFVLVQGFLLYSIVRFGAQPDDDTDGPAVARQHQARILLDACCPPSPSSSSASSATPRSPTSTSPRPNELVVEVKGFQYAWQFYYPEYDVTSTELHVPVDRQLHLKLRSNDVVHSFWVPAMRIKKDVMPDRVTETFITPTETGSYPDCLHRALRRRPCDHALADGRPIRCRLPGLALPASRKPPRRPRRVRPILSPRAARSSTSAGCNACHALKDAGAAGAVGPSWTASARPLRAGSPANRPRSTSTQSIVKPNEFVVAGLPGQHHAPGLRAAPVGAGPRRAGQVSDRNEVR